MPNYKFKCLECGHEFQKLLPPAHNKQKCLECGHHETQKQLEAPGVQFKGEGFYLTDSRKKPEKSADSDKSRTPSEKESKSDSDKKKKD